MTDLRPARLAYVTTFDPADVHAWSGTVNGIAQCLVGAGFDLEPMGLRPPARLRTKAMKLAWRTAGASLLRDREPLITRGYAAEAGRRLRSVDHDIVFSPGTVPVGYLETTKPIVIWTDATFEGLVDYYEAFTGLSRRSLRNGHALEQSALDRCSLALYSSQWAASSAIEHYRVDPHKVHVVSFGANMPGEPTREDVLTAIDGRDPLRCELLFVGVDWERKGGEVAVAAVEAMNRAGMPTELHVVGALPPRSLPSFVKVHGFISKREPAGRQRLSALYARAHFLIGPSDADCTPIVFGEALCHGLPVLAADTGGVASLIRSGVNGHLLAPGAAGEDYARIALAAMSDSNQYRQLALDARQEYETRLNWDAAGSRVRQLVTEHINVPLRAQEPSAH